MISRALQVAALVASLSLVSAIDIILKEVTCDESLPLSLEDNDLTMECDGSPQCSLGTDASLVGSLRFSGVDDVGLEDGYAFASVDLEFVGVQIDMLQYLQVPICGEYVSAAYDDDGMECPEDGVYNFSLEYPLPVENSRAMWMATGWEGHGEIAFYSQVNNPDSMIGICQLQFATSVTASTSSSPLAKIPIPSAMTTTLVVVAFAAFLVLTCLWRMMRDLVFGKKKKKSEVLKDAVLKDEEAMLKDEEGTTQATTTDFTQMKD